MKTITGNLLDMFDNGDFDVIVHGCNLQSKMDGGIAYQIAQRYPEAVEVDDIYGQGLGGYSVGFVKPDYKFVVNAYTQILPGRDARLFAIAKVFRTLKPILAEWKVGIPMIGSGIGGLEWSDVELVLDRIDLPTVTVVEFG